LFHAGEAAGHAANQVVLIAIIDSQVRVRRPDQNGIDAALALFEIVEVTVDGVLAGGGIVEVAILNHHLRLREAGLRPLQCRQIVPGAVVANSDAPFRSPVCDISEPRLVFGLAARLRSAFLQALHGQAFRYGNLLSVGGEV
jgi:hypothetical protein